MRDDLKMASPHKMRVIVESTIKTDKIEAQVIADLLRSNYLPACYVPSPRVRQLRELLRQRVFLVRLKTMVKNRIYSLLDKLGVRHPFTNLFAGRGMDFLHSLQLGEMDQFELEELLALLKFLQEREKRSNDLIRQLAQESNDCRLLMTIPGIGSHNALLILAEMGEVNRFANGERYASYCSILCSLKSE